MRRYQWIIRGLFAVIFIAGAPPTSSRSRPAEGYAASARPRCSRGCESCGLVMPNIGWLTIALGIYEIVCGAGMLWKRTVSLAALGMIAFLVFITIVGYGFPTNSIGEDLLKNRSITIVMALLLVPLLRGGRHPR